MSMNREEIKELASIFMTWMQEVYIHLGSSPGTRVQPGQGTVRQ